MEVQNYPVRSTAGHREWFSLANFMWQLVKGDVGKEVLCIQKTLAVGT